MNTVKNVMTSPVLIPAKNEDAVRLSFNYRALKSTSRCKLPLIISEIIRGKLTIKDIVPMIITDEANFGRVLSL